MVTTALLFLALLAWFPRPPIPALTGFHQVRHLLVPLALPLGLLALATGSLFGAALAVGALLGWIGVFGERLTPKPIADPQDTVGDLRLVTLNVGDHRSDVDQIVDYLRGVDADVVCLQEVAAAHIEAFERSLTEEYPHRTYQGEGLDGMALLTKFPVRSANPLQWTGRLRSQHTTLDVDGKKLTVINIHPFASIAALGNRSSSAEDVRRIAEIASEGPPTIVMGDFNSTDQSHAYHAMESAGLKDVFRAVQGTFGPTFPVPLRYLYLPIPPIVRIDFHWHTSHFVALESRVGPDASSDHLPLESTVSWHHDSLELPKRGAVRRPEGEANRKVA